MTKIKLSSLKSTWTQIFMFLRSHNRTSEIEFSTDQTDENLNTVYNLFETVSDLCQLLFDTFPIKDENAKSIIKNLILNNIFNNEMKTKLHLPLKNYCKILIQSFECPNPKYFILFDRMFNIMKSCSIPIENVFIDVCIDVLKEYIKNILSYYNNEYDVNVLEKIFEKKTLIIENKVIPGLFPQTYNNGNLKSFLSLEFFHRIYFETRVGSIFDIVMDYPDSALAINDLRTCILVLNSGMVMCNKLKSEINQRLLHPAVATPDLISGYICIIKSLRLLDPTYVFEEIVTPDIRSYLLKREDTIKSIVDKILTVDEESDNCIYHELAQPTPITIIPQGGLTESGDVKCNLKEMYDWIPDPIDSVGIRSLWYKRLDVLSLLLSIYNSRELFASEYKNLLSQRLVKKIDFDVDKELRNLETLKLRFGQDYLQDCDVMLKDIRESKRINNTIQEKITLSEIIPKFNIQSYVISAEYWSKMTDREFQLPEKLKIWFDSYSKHYSDYKRNRELKWYQMLGSVEIEVELNNKFLKMDVTPLQATIIYCFAENPRWELGILAQNLQLNLSVVRRAINFWVQKDFLKRVKEHGISETYMILNNEEAEVVDDKKRMIDIDIDGDSDEDNGEANLKNEMYQNLWMIVKFILTHASTQKQLMDIDKIFSTLPTYTSGDPIKITKEQLEIFMDNKVSQKLLVVNHKNYFLNKSSV